jgi:hypothetical protein
VTNNMPLTLVELTTRIATSANRQELVRGRIKSWTAKWVLRGSTPGRGGVRKFNHLMILDAALLDVLSDCGLQVVSWDLRPALYLMRDAAQAWAAGDTRPRWLQLTMMPPLPDRLGQRGWTVSLPLIAESEQQTPALALSANEAVIVVDLTAILRRLQWGPADQQAIEVDRKRRIIR